MAKNDEPAKASNGNSTQPSLNVLAQYVKDLSFESPGAPASLRGREQAPGININVNVSANPLSEKEFDVNLTLSAEWIAIRATLVEALQPWPEARAVVSARLRVLESAR